MSGINTGLLAWPLPHCPPDIQPVFGGPFPHFTAGPASGPGDSRNKWAGFGSLGPPDTQPVLLSWVVAASDSLRASGIRRAPSPERSRFLFVQFPSERSLQLLGRAHLPPAGCRQHSTWPTLLVQVRAKMWGSGPGTGVRGPFLHWALGKSVPQSPLSCPAHFLGPTVERQGPLYSVQMGEFSGYLLWAGQMQVQRDRPRPPDKLPGGKLRRGKGQDQGRVGRRGNVGTWGCLMPSSLEGSTLDAPHSNPQAREYP